MDVYFSPLACSMASRICLYEAGAPARFVEVDPKTKRTSDGSDYFAVNPLGLVPAIRTADGEVLTENAAVLQFIADQWPAADLAPRAGMERSRLHQWLCFIGTELHKATFIPLFDKTMPEAMRAKTLETAARRFAYLDRHLAGREFLLDRFSVADAYLFTVLRWSERVGLDLGKWKNVVAFRERVAARPKVQEALKAEGLA